VLPGACFGHILVRICRTINCELGDIMELSPDDYQAKKRGERDAARE